MNFVQKMIWSFQSFLKVVLRLFQVNLIFYQQELHCRILNYLSFKTTLILCLPAYICLSYYISYFFLHSTAFLQKNKIQIYYKTLEINIDNFLMVNHNPTQLYLYTKMNYALKYALRTIGRRANFAPRITNPRLLMNCQVLFSSKTPDELEASIDSKPNKITAENSQQIIDKWVKQNKVILFMKGTPANPQCGYSNFVVQLLKKYGLNEYKSINILEDPLIREQVKIYSKWPTYPQLYIAGQLVGGSDILHQMHKDQSLQKLLIDKKLI